jgi:hypothetical protein
MESGFAGCPSVSSFASDSGSAVSTMFSNTTIRDSLPEATRQHFGIPGQSALQLISISAIAPGFQWLHFLNADTLKC